MEFKELPQAIITIVIIGLVIGIGVIVLDQFGAAAKESTITLNESITIASHTGTPTNDDIISIQYFNNLTTFVISNNETTSTILNITGQDKDTVVLGGGFIDGVYNISYTYDADSEASIAADSTRDAVDDFVTWLPVIIIIIAAAIILGLVMRSFTKA